MSDPIVNSNLSESRWVEQIVKTFKLEFVVDIDNPPCVFKVPKTLKDTNSKAYTPQQIGLGPYHHLRPEFHILQRHKLAAIKKYLTRDEFQNFQSLVVNRLVEIEPIIRTWYDEYIDINGDTLALILAIDGLYLLHILSTYEKGELSETAFGELAMDLIMLENQIPFVLINEIRFAFKLIGTKDNPMLFSVYIHFCKAHSPLKLNEQEAIIHDTKIPHLLAYIYHLIVNNRGSVELEPRFAMEKGTCVSNLVTIVNIGADHHIKMAEKLQKLIKSVQSIPLQRFSGFFKKLKQINDKKPVVEEIQIPSASQLREIAKVEFKITRGGIRDVSFNDEEHTFYLPVITIKADSEVILRNLVAYEAATATQQRSILEFAEYVELMCGIVDTSNDVSLLRQDGIIISDLNDEEISDIFNGIRKSTGEKTKKSAIDKAIDEVNEEFDNTFQVKVYKFLQQRIYKSWKFLTLLSTIVLIMLLVLQSFCEIYGCNDRWFGNGKSDA